MNDMIRNAQHAIYVAKATVANVTKVTVANERRAEPSYEFHDVSVPIDIQELRDAINVVRTEVYMLAQRLAEVERWQRDIMGEF